MVDFNAYSVDELVSMRDELNASIKAKRAEAKDAEKATREARGIEMANALSGAAEGTKVAFLYNKERTEGTFVRKNEKTVTVKFEKDGEEKSMYRKFYEILEVIE
jgi:hypothetical protein